MNNLFRSHDLFSRWPFLCLLAFMQTGAVKADLAATCDVAQQLDCSNALNEVQSGWQFGVGVATALQIPEYIGSDESHNYLLPVPYITYNSPNLKVSQSGITGKLFNSDRWFLSLSLSGAIPVDSDDNKARSGMNDLEAVFEYGPSLKYFFSGNDESTDAVYFDFNFREARRLSLKSLDISSSPAFIARQRLAKKYWQGNVSVFGQVRWEFVSDSYANYFYGVEQKYQTSERDSFDAKGGYAGFRLSSGARWQRGKHIWSIFFAYADISSASYAKSPLVKTDTHLYGGSAYFWLF
ncbi:MAG: MipA/OmpV family protein [Gammaproteobacteria bacterium]|nr:MipA/OmpV family protein [Gammaproteobacteria bacterium]